MAYTKLLKPRGYRLVGSQHYGFNAFFIREGLGEDVLPERTTGEVYARQNWSEQSARELSKYKWQQV